MELIQSISLKISYAAKVLTWIADTIGRGIASFPDYKNHEREFTQQGGERSRAGTKGVQ